MRTRLAFLLGAGVALSLVMLVFCGASRPSSFGGSGTSSIGNTLTACIPGPPLYSCTNVGNAAIQTPPPPISGITSVNTIAYDTSLNPGGTGLTGTNPFVEATDSLTCNTLCSGNKFRSWAFGRSQGNNDHAWSCTGRADLSAACGSATKYLFEVTQGGCMVLLDLNLTTMQIGHPVPTRQYCGQGGFSGNDPTIYYFAKINSGAVQIFKEVMAAQNPTSVVETMIFDASTDPAWPGAATFIDDFSGNDTDTDFIWSQAVGGVGQNAQQYVMHWRPGSGLRVWNTLTGAVTGWGSTGTVSTACRFHVHGEWMFFSGQYAWISAGDTPTGCALATVDHFWQIGTLTVNDCLNSASGNCTGHQANGWTSAVLSNNPSFRYTPAAGSPTGVTTIFTLPTSQCEKHIGWGSVDSTESQIIVASSACTNGTWSSPYLNEIYGFYKTGDPPKRFFHTFDLGVGKSTNFFCNNATAIMSRDGKVIGFNSDMLGTLGTDNNSQPACQAFIGRAD